MVEAVQSSSQFRSGAGNPGAGLGRDGDSYLNTTTGDWWAKAAGVWGQVFDASTIQATPKDASVTTAKLAAGLVVPYNKLGLTGSIQVADLAFDPATQAELDAVSLAARARAWGDAMVVPAAPGISYSGGNAVLGAINYRGYRCVAHKTGTLTDFLIWVGTASGNVEGVIIDDGSASAGNRTRLWTSGVIPCPAASAGIDTYRSLGNPNLSVTKGQHFDLVIGTSDGTASLMRTSSFFGSSAMAKFPAGYMAPSPGIPWLVWNDVLGAMGYPATRAESNLVLFSIAYSILTRIV